MVKWDHLIFMNSTTFSDIAVIGGVIKCEYKDALSDQVEVISIIQDAISHIDSPIPSSEAADADHTEGDKRDDCE